MPVIEGGQVLLGGQDFGGVLGGQVLYGGQEIEPEQGGRTQPDSEAVEMSVGPFRRSGAPPNGWYNGVADKGAIAVDILTGDSYRNTGTKAATVWTADAPAVSFFTHFGVIGDLSLQTYPLVVGGADYLGSVGSWSNDSNDDLVAPVPGRYLCQFGLSADQSEVSPIAVSLQINSPTSAYLVEQIKLYLPVAPAGTAQVISTSGMALSQSLIDAPLSLGQLQVQHHIAGGVDADLRIFVRLFRVGDAI